MHDIEGAALGAVGGVVGGTIYNEVQKKQGHPENHISAWKTGLGGAAIGGDGQARALADAGPLLAHGGPFTHDRPTHAAADLCGVHIELGEGAAEGVAVHSKLDGGLALVALVLREHLEEVALLELPHGIRIRDSGTAHLHDQGVHFALQDSTSLAFVK